MVKIDAKRIWFITDTHLGVKNSAREWREIHMDYFKNFFIPLVKEHYQEGDILCHLGDLFDSRHAITIPIINYADDLFGELAEIFPEILIFIGNHDIWAKDTNDQNSVKHLKRIPNVKVYEEPEEFQIGPARIIGMPWRKDAEAEKEVIRHYGKADYVFCHTDIKGVAYNGMVKVKEGIGIDDFAGFKRVYSGHIHYAQNIGNVNMLGAPYSMTRSDISNTKGITLLDLATNEETFFENDYSPKFIRIKFDQLLQMTIPEVENHFRNNFVDVLIQSEHVLKTPVNLFLDQIEDNYRSIEFFPYNNELEEEILENGDIIVFEDKGFDLLDLAQKHIDALPYDKEIKDKLYKSMTKLKKITEDMINKVE